VHTQENTLGAVRESALVSRHAHWTAKHSLRFGQVSFKLYVTKTKLVHNHPLFRETFIQYPATRVLGGGREHRPYFCRLDKREENRNVCHHADSFDA
ncbi:hypothetical protein PF005_g32215, partial [Phytophthora fragariae]